MVQEGPTRPPHVTEQTGWFVGAGIQGGQGSLRGRGMFCYGTRPAGVRGHGVDGNSLAASLGAPENYAGPLLEGTGNKTDHP